MPPHDTYDDEAAQGSSFLSPSSPKTPTRHTIKDRRSNASLRGAANHTEEFVSNGQHSLAHELAVALMPEPSAGSRLLAEEFGIEYDEGAEGIDDDSHPTQDHLEAEVPSFADELQSAADTTIQEPLDVHDSQPFTDNSVPRSPKSEAPRRSRIADQDAMEVLAQNLQITDGFLSHLRTIDAETGVQTAQQPALEKIASEVIRHINESTRNREEQVRELLEYEREFRKIAAELGGNDVLGQLEELTQVEDLVDSKSPIEAPKATAGSLTLEPVEEEQSQDWEVDPDRHLRHHQRQYSFDEDDAYDPEASPVKDTFPPAPAVVGPATPSTTIPHLSHLRSFTVSLVSSLTTISEQCQVNGAATTDAGRKIRALKNKLGDWRTDWDSAEKSRMKIERWEAGIVDGTGNGAPPPLTSPVRVGFRRVDGREVVQEHLKAFESALSDAAQKTQAIMSKA